MEPHWEHGYRCHGFWFGRTRIGFIGLTPYWFRKRPEVSWSFDLPSSGARSGAEKSVIKAKHLIEQAYRLSLIEASTQEDFFDAVRNDPDLKPEYKEYWLSLEPKKA
jgi:hypothetical protein